MLQNCNVTVAGKAVTVSLANLVWDLTDVSTLQEVSFLMWYNFMITAPLPLRYYAEPYRGITPGGFVGTNSTWCIFWNQLHLVYFLEPILPGGLFGTTVFREKTSQSADTDFNEDL